MYIFKLIYVIIFLSNIQKIRCQISDKRLCVDEKCSEPVSLGKTLLPYSSIDAKILSFKSNVDVTIYSKEAGKNEDLWGAEINGKRGYVPKKFIREQRILKKPTILVDTEPNIVPKVPSADKNVVSPSKVKENYQVIDGTTIYENDPQDMSISPTSTITPSLASSIVENTLSDQLKENSSQQENFKEGIDLSLSNSKKDESNLNVDSLDIDDEDEDTDEDEDDEDSEEIEDVKNGAEQSATEETKQESVQNIELDENVLKNTNHSAVDTVKKNTGTVATEEQLNADNSKNDVPNLSPYNLEIDPQMKDNILKEAHIDDVKSSETVNVLNVNTEKNILPVTQNNQQEKIEIVKEDNLQKDVQQSVTVREASVEIESMPINFEKTEEIPLATTASPLVDDVAPPLPLVDVENVTPIPQQQTLSQPVDAVNNQTEAVASENVPPNDNDNRDNAKHVQAATATVSDANKPNEDVLKPEESLEVPQIPSVESVGGLVGLFQSSTEAYSESFEKTVGVEASSIEKNEEAMPDKIGGEEEVIHEKSNNIQDIEEAVREYSEKSDVIQEDIASDLNEKSSEKTVDAEASSIEKTGEAIPDKSDTDKIEGAEEVIDEKSNGIKDIGEAVLEYSGKSDVIQDDIPSDLNENPVRYFDSDNDEKNTPPSDEIEEDVNTNIEKEESGDIISSLFSFFGKNVDAEPAPENILQDPIEEITASHNIWSDDKNIVEEICSSNNSDQLPFTFNSDIFLYLITTAGSCLIFLFIFMLMDRNRREGPFVAKINKLEKELLVVLKENELLQEQQPQEVHVDTSATSTLVEDLRNQLVHLTELNDHLERQVEQLNAELDDKKGLEEQIENLEKELETSTEVGMELNRIISEMLDPTNGSERLKENVEQLQRQLLEQKETITTTQEALNLKEMEIEALQIDLAESRKKTNSLETQLDQLLEKLVNIEKEKEEQNTCMQKEVTLYREKYEEAVLKKDNLDKDLHSLRMELAEAQRQAELKTKEFQILKEEVGNMQSDGQMLDTLMDISSMKAQLEQLKSENEKYSMQLNQERQIKCDIEKKYQVIEEEMIDLKKRYENTDKLKMEATMKLEVLNNYFKKRESELQEEVLKYKSIFEAKEGAATSTSERIKLMLEEIENYKSQNESLKQEILSQEIDLKSQISVLEKKVHENWVNARQCERKLEDARQEAAQLRNRLTLRERAFIEERSQNRLQSPIDQNGDSTLSPLPSLDSPASPPPIYGGPVANRDHITKSPPPPLTGLPPPPFLPPPPGAPFMPPPLPGMPPFMPPPPAVFPGDHRPPPLGRMSSPPPPLNSRYSPDVSPFSPFDRHSPSLYDDSATDYGTTPPVRRGYSPFNGRDDRREYNKRQSHRNHRNMKGPAMSSGSDHSDNSMDKHGRNNKSNMV